MSSVSNVEQLAHDQLQAYNQSDLDAFCACYHSDIQILDQEGQCLSLAFHLLQAPPVSTSA